MTHIIKLFNFFLSITAKLESAMLLVVRLGAAIGDECCYPGHLSKLTARMVGDYFRYGAICWPGQMVN